MLSRLQTRLYLRWAQRKFRWETWETNCAEKKKNQEEDEEEEEDASWEDIVQVAEHISDPGLNIQTVSSHLSPTRSPDMSVESYSALDESSLRALVSNMDLRRCPELN